MNNNIGKFIKAQREKNNISQTKLAELLFVDRTLISKWENDKLTPNIKEIIDMAKIFNISVEEFLSKEEYDNSNSEKIENNLKQYLLNQDNKLRKAKKYILTLSIISVLFLLIFFIYYFYQTYNKTRVYIVGAIGENYKFNNGIFILTRGKSYLKIGNISNDVNRVKIFYELNNSEKVIYDGDPNDTYIDLTGYDSSINLHNIDSIINNIKMIIYTKDNKSELAKLEFEEDFANKYLIYSDMDTNMEYDKKSNDKNIPKNIQKYFKCDETICVYEIDNVNLKYDIVGKIFYITKENDNITYYVRNSIFSYNNESLSFSVINNNYNLNDFDYEKAKNIYDYYMNLILKYIG